MTIGIYTITNKVNGKTYVGQSMNIEKRWKNHLGSLKKGTHPNYNLQKDFIELGEENFCMLVAKEVEPVYLNRWESMIAHQIDVWSFGYNMTGMIDFSDFSEEDSKIACEKIMQVVLKRTFNDEEGKVYYYDALKVGRELGYNRRHITIALRENIYRIPRGDLEIHYCGLSMLITVFYYNTTKVI